MRKDTKTNRRAAIGNVERLDQRVVPTTGYSFSFGLAAMGPIANVKLAPGTPTPPASPTSPILNAAHPAGTAPGSTSPTAPVLNGFGFGGSTGTPTFSFGQVAGGPATNPFNSGGKGTFGFGTPTPGSPTAPVLNVKYPFGTTTPASLPTTPVFNSFGPTSYQVAGGYGTNPFNSGGKGTFGFGTPTPASPTAPVFSSSTGSSFGFQGGSYTFRF